MTAQASEIIWLDGNRGHLLSTPLDAYLGGLERPPELVAGSTALWRGYQGTWSIEDGWLLLTGIEGAMRDADGSVVDVTIERLFPGQRAPIVAAWFSGVLRVGTGEVVSYEHLGFARTYEDERLIVVEAGRVVGEMEHTPDAPPPRPPMPPRP